MTVRAPSKVGPRQQMLAGAAMVFLGLACVGTSHPEVGGFALLLGWALLGVGVHGFGRSNVP